MAPVTKSKETDGSSRSPNKSSRQSRREYPSSGGSLSSKSQSTRTNEGRSHRTRRPSLATKSSLQEALSSFGDDVVRVKNYPGLYAYDNHGYFQPDISFDYMNPHLHNSNSYQVNSTSSALSQVEDSSDSPPVGEKKEGVEGELAIIMSHHDPNFQTKHFEKVNPNEVGVRASRWQKLMQASTSSDRFQKFRTQGRKSFTRKGDDSSSPENCDLETFYNSHGRIEFNPPFWGVSRSTRKKISFLSLSLVLHELACFTSCILLGCFIFQGMEAISWTQEEPVTNNWAFFKWYSSFQTILVVVSSVGFLSRVNTTELRSLWLLPLFLFPVLCLSISDYCNKAWELQRLECHNFFQLDHHAQQKVHLTQDCPLVLVPPLPVENMNNDATKGIPNPEGKPTKVSLSIELGARGTAYLVMRIIGALSALVISIHLFCCRQNHFLVDLFGPPREFTGNIELITLRRNETRKSNNAEAHDNDKDDVEVLFNRTEKLP